MIKILLNQFEDAIRQREPAVADSLQRGLPEEDIRKTLREAGVNGNIAPIVSVFSWKNGSQLSPEFSPFPKSIYSFGNLRTMIEHFLMFHEAFIYHPKFEQADRRYFPIFWDTSAGYLAIDLKSLSGRLVLLDPETEDMARDAYATFEDFLKDAVRANKERDNLACF